MDRSRIEDFLEAFTGFVAGSTTIGLLAVADRSGLSSYLGSNPPGTSEQIAEGADLEERYVREILSGLVAAGVVDYEPESQVFGLPPEHALFISDDSSPYFMGGWLDMIPSVMSQVEGVARSTVHGGGVGFEEFGKSIIRGIDRGNTPSQRIFLTSRWLPAVPGLEERLNEGIRIADVGSGSGSAAIAIAEAFPNSMVFGFDVSEASVAVASSRSEDIPNVEFGNYSAESIPTDPGFDLITAFDVIHDLADPGEGLRRIREALAEDGLFFVAEPNVSSDLEDNINSTGALFYGISALHCMTQSLAVGGEGLGAAWGETRLRDYAADAGFERVERLEAITNRFTAFYALRP